MVSKGLPSFKFCWSWTWLNANCYFAATVCSNGDLPMFSLLTLFTIWLIHPRHRQLLYVLFFSDWWRDTHECLDQKRKWDRFINRCVIEINFTSRNSSKYLGCLEKIFVTQTSQHIKTPKYTYTDTHTDWWEYLASGGVESQKRRISKHYEWSFIHIKDRLLII